MTKDAVNHAGPRTGHDGSEHFPFAHGDGAARSRSDRISSTTRYLGAAAYIDEKYAEAVIDGLVASSHRAVVPTLGYDVATVIRHCFRAQRLWLAQNALITAILVLGLILLTWPTVAAYVVCLVGYAVLTQVPDVRRWPTWKAVVAVVAIVAVLGCLLAPLLSIGSLLGSGAFDNSTFDNPTFDSPAFEGQPTGDGQAVRTLTTFVVEMALIVLATVAALAWSRHRMITIITSDLARGRPPGPPQPLSPPVEQRLRVIDDAQHGNIVLHSGFEPFIGSGYRVNAWSIATELRPDEEDPGPSGNGRSSPPRRVQIDPVELVAHLRQRLAALRSHDLPPRERITGLLLRDQIVSSGTRWHDFPLIDEAVSLPYSHATPDAIDAIIRHPQTSARHFLRATVGAPDKAAVATDGRTVMPAEHQSVVSTTYLHVAVEGGMLYVELVATVLGPIQQHFLNIDSYDNGSDRLATACGEAARGGLQATAVAPWRLVRSLVRAVTLTNAINRADRDAAGEAVYDFGANLDVRELASRDGYANYLQRLDAEKYSRLIDRRATAAIEEVLTANGVDASDFTAKVNFRQYNSTTIGGSAYGPVVTGTAASATMTTAEAAAPSGGTSKKGAR